MKLSIAVTTYNHEKYIAQALDSIYSQDVDFDFEVVIGDDASKDKTVSIIKEYQKKYTNIRLLEQKKNVGYTINFDATLRACLGEYIAIFDGDDIMLPTKLKKQVFFLDNNPDYVMSTHKTRAFNSKTGDTIRYIYPPKKKEFYNIEDLIKYGSIFANSSKIFRKLAYPKNGIDFNIEKIADWYITVLIASKGKINYFDECLLDYRVHSSSIMKRTNGYTLFKDTVYILDAFSIIFNKKYNYLFKRMYSYAYLIKGIYLTSIKRNKKARKFFVKSIIKCPFYSLSAYVRFLLTFLPESVSNYIMNLKQKDI